MESTKLTEILNEFTGIIRSIIADELDLIPTELEVQNILADLLDENKDIGNLDHDDVKSRYLDLQ